MKPTIGLLLGDPTGIGPEITAKVLANPQVVAHARIVVIGDRRIFDWGQRIAGVSLDLPVVEDADGPPASGDGPVVLDQQALAPSEVTLGEVSPAAGAYCLKMIELALDLAGAGYIDAIVYPPLNKHAMRLAGSPFPDEFHYMADQLQWEGHFGEVNVGDDVWTTRVTSHVAIKDVASLITEERILKAIRLARQSLLRFGLHQPRIAVSALNPHAGERGLFGTEEQEVIAPAIERAQNEGMDVRGPFPADTVFLRAREGAFDAVVCMYHDQGQIAMKLLASGRGVTVSGGLPIPIVTVAHGTAHDIAGSGTADPEALEKAVQVAVRLAAGSG